MKKNKFYSIDLIKNTLLDFLNAERHITKTYKSAYKKYDKNIIKGHIFTVGMVCSVLGPLFYIFSDRIALGNTDIKWFFARLFLVLSSLSFSYFSQTKIFDKINSYRFPLIILVTIVVFCVAVANYWEPRYQFGHNFYYPLIGAVLLNLSFGKSFLYYLFFTAIQYPILINIKSIDGEYYGNFYIFLEMFIPVIILILIKSSHIRSIRKFIAEYDLNALQKEFIKKEKEGALGQLACYLGHEINSPLYIILNSNNNIQKLIKSPNDLNIKKLETNTSRIRRSTDRIVEVISSIDYLTQEDSDKVKVESNIYQIVNNSIRSQLSDLAGAGVEIEYSYEEKSKIIRCCAPHIEYTISTILKRIIFELKTYPTKDTKKIVSINLAELNDIVDIIFSYSAEEISKDLKEEITSDAFENRNQELGKGLNLDLVKFILSDHKGYIDVNKDDPVLKIQIPTNAA